MWDKLSGAGNMYAFSHELLLYGAKKVHTKKGRNVWRINGFNSGAKHTYGKKVHPTQKPMEIIARIVRDGSAPGDLVFDPFSGSGTTALVCKSLGRNFVGYELDIANFQTIRDRFARGGTPLVFIDL